MVIFHLKFVLDLDEPDSSTNISLENNEITKINHESSYDADDSDEVASTISGLSGLSDISGEDWNPVASKKIAIKSDLFMIF